METRTERKERSAREAKIFANQNGPGTVVVVATNDLRSATFFTPTVIEKDAYDNFGVPVVKLEGWSLPIPIRYVKSLRLKVTYWK